MSVDIFNSIVQISKVLDGNFEFPKARFRQHLSSLPEVKLICILIVGVKLYQPFDGLPRYLRTADEIGILEIDWDKWSKLQQEQNSSNEEDDLQHKDPMQVSERDVFGMSNSQIDAYLDWYAETWIDEEPMHHGSKHIPEQLLNMFPIERLDGSTPVKPVFQPGKKVSYEPMLGNLKRAQESLKLRAVVSEGAEGKRTKPVRRIGDSYKHYRQVEDLSQHPHAKGFHDAVAKVTGIELSVLLRAVFRIERKLHRFWQDTQRTGGFGEEGGEGSDRQAEEVSDEELVSKEDAMATVVETDIEMED
ncbi:MAG: hypothetical protein MMC33_001727 [Icmadophila ericetorum]|nr:hypothetical protein [Icmadophila ericetorum]